MALFFQEGMDKIKEVVCAAVLAREDVEKVSNLLKMPLSKENYR